MEVRIGLERPAIELELICFETVDHVLVSAWLLGNNQVSTEGTYNSTYIKCGTVGGYTVLALRKTTGGNAGPH